MARKPIHREPIHREPIHREPIHREPIHREPSDNVGFLIGDVSRMLRTVYDRKVEPLGLTRAQWRVLSRIHRMEGCTQTELASVLEIEKPTLGKLLDRLCDKGWVERRADDADARIKRLFLTETVLPLIDQMYALADDVLDNAIAGLKPAEAKQLHITLSLIKENLAQMLNGHAVAEKSEES
jgi:MarR family transcriptional regulator for hemolysin